MQIRISAAITLLPYMTIMHKGMYLFLTFITLDAFVLPSYSAKEIPFQY